MYKPRKHRPIIYKYYRYLRHHHYGRENGINRDELAKIFKIDPREQRHILQEINSSSEFDKLVSTYGKIYMCRTEDEASKAAFNEVKVGITRLMKGKAMIRKINRNGQAKIKIGKDYKDFCECFEE